MSDRHRNLFIFAGQRCFDGDVAEIKVLIFACNHDNLVARFKTGTCRRRIRYDITNDGGGQVYADKKDYHENNDRANDIAGNSRGQHRRSGKKRLVHERARIFRIRCRAGVVLTEHLHEAAERDKADTVFGFAGGAFAADGEA